ncbi:MAG: hypothetical protein KDB04_03130 [Acidimicrobiales bacterium]|nr:hypothetical protein [Acidimicrobiales bacterium]HRW38031.1 hypothetical protein [Aquihabitans sp.]
MITADYQIELEGELGHDLHPAFAPALVEAGDGRTRVLATGIDQAALHDLLDRARDLGLALLGVEVVGDDAEVGTDPTAPPR